jgi:hypothetical protein
LRILVLDHDRVAPSQASICAVSPGYLPI